MIGTKAFRLTFLLCLLLSRAIFASGNDFILQNVHILDPERETVETGNLWVKGGVVQETLKEIPANFRGKILEGKGGWVLPGFTDAHTHSTWGNPGLSGGEPLTAEQVSKVMLYCGVTAYLDLFADEDLIFRARDEMKLKNYRGASLFAAGPMFTCTNGHGTDFGIPPRIVDTPAEAERQVSALATKKPDVIKIVYDHARDYRSMDLATMKAVIKAAKAREIPTVVHIGTWKDAAEAVAAGANAITHLYESEIPDSLVVLMHQKGVVEIPTMVYQTELWRVSQDPSLLSLPLLVAVASPGVVQSYRNPNQSPSLKTELQKQSRSNSSYAASLKKLDAGGVSLLTGTDSGGALAVFQGYSVHREMEVLVNSGVSVWHALAASTSNPRRFLKISSGLKSHQRADFVVLSASPLEDIRNTQKILQVVHDGQVVDRSALVRQLSSTLPK